MDFKIFMLFLILALVSINNIAQAFKLEQIYNQLNTLQQTIKEKE